MSRPPKSARRQFAAAILVLEAFVVFFAALVMYGLDLATVAVIVGAGTSMVLLCVVAAGLLRRPLGYVLGWIVQVLLVVLGLFVPMMLILGLVFLTIWMASMRLGGQIDVERAERAAAAEEPAGEDPVGEETDRR